MAEPIGGKEHRWRWSKLFDFPSLLNLSASVVGWIVLLLLPLYIAAEAYIKAEWIRTSKFHFVSAAPGKPKRFPWESVSDYVQCLLISLVSLTCFLIVGISVAVLLLSLMNREKKTVASSASMPDVSPVGDPVKSGSSTSDSSTGGDKSSLPLTAPSDQEKQKAELDRKKVEQERREKVEKAKKDFKVKLAAFKDSLPRSFDLNVAGGSVDFSEKFKATPLKVVMKEGSLRSYLSWDHEAMTLKVNDPFAFFKDEEARFSLEISDPVAAVDSELRDEVKPEPLVVVLRAKYPSAAQKFFEWKAKLPASIRLDNAKQGQPADYDIRALLGYDPDWAAWVRAEGLGSLQPDFDGHRIKGDPTVGSDFKLHLVFACRGCEEITHELDLLLTCNMDPELRWREIERDQSDESPVVSAEDKLLLVKMADAVRSTANSYEVRKPDDTFSKANRVSRRQKSEDFDLAYASIRGRSHIRNGSFREDDVEARFFLEGKAVAIVVSDGAGSAPLSRRGSCIVTAVGIKCLIELGQKLVNDPEALKGRTQSAIDGFADAVRSIRSQIEFEAECIKEQRPDFLAKEMYATFLAALVLPTDSGQVLLTYSAGDGAIGLGLAGDASGIKCSPDHGQSAGQTLFVLNKGADDAEKRLVFTSLPASYALLLMSDGVSDPRFLEGSEIKPEFWNQLSDELKPLVREEPLNHDAERVESYKDRGALCAWLDSYEKSHHDDLTILALFHKLT